MTEHDIHTHFSYNPISSNNDQENFQTVNTSSSTLTTLFNQSQSSLNSLIESALSQSKTKELEYLCNELLKFNKYKSTQVTSQQSYPLSEFESIPFKIHSSLERLIIETISMKDIPSRNEKLKSLKQWYLKQITSYNSLAQIKERTSKTNDQLHKPEAPLPEPESPETMKKHRCLIPGYEKPYEKIEEYKRHKIISKPNLELDLNSDHYYFRMNRMKQDKEALFTNTMNNFASTCYTTQSTMKFNKTMYNTTGSGWYHANNNLGFYDKEIKGGFSYARPDYEYAQLIVNKDVIQSKHRELNEKRFGEEIKEMMNDFGVSRARYKQNVNKNMEMKTIINTYSKILVKMRDKDKEERTKLKNKVATKGETKTQPQAQPQQQQQQLQQSQPEQQPQLPQEQIQNQDEAITINNENNNIDTKEQTQIITPPPKPEEHHDKVNINNIQYISNFNEESAANFMDYINQTKNKEKTISINFKSSKLTKLDILLTNQLHSKYEKDAEIEDKIKQTNNENEKSELLKTITTSSLASDTLSALRQRNKVFHYRILGSSMNEFNIYERDRHKKYLTPLSGYDPTYVSQFKIKKQHTEDNNNNNNNGRNSNYFLKTFSQFPNDYLQMRKTVSKFNETTFQRSKVFKKGNKKYKIHMKQMSSAIKDNNKVYPENYLPIQGNSLLRSEM